MDDFEKRMEYLDREIEIKIKMVLVIFAIFTFIFGCTIIYTIIK